MLSDRDRRAAAGPLAVSEESRPGRLIYQASPEARARGVWPGMTVSAARVMCPELAVRRRQPRWEQRRLEEIAGWMLSFSPIVSIQAPDTALLEVRGSLNLFGGLDRLMTLIRSELAGAGHEHRLAGAPVPLAAQYLARWGRETVVTDKAGLRSALGDMPIGLLSLDAGAVARLERADLRILRDLWRLPADGLARRFGTALAGELDRLQGRRPDPRSLHEPPARFSAILMLDWASDDLAQIEQAVDCLLRQWVDYLRRSARGTSGFVIECLAERGNESTRAEIGIRHISRDLDHMRRLAAEQLHRTRFPGPVAGVVLASDRIHPFRERNRQLFDTGEETAVQWRQTEELLETRLGGRGLEALHTVAEHRPEFAWSRVSPPHSAGRPAGGGRRPLWLLDTPRPLAWSGEPPPGRGPERIETGWWDQRDRRRDYYVTIDDRGRRLWVFRDLRRRQWYLHGLFG